MRFQIKFICCLGNKSRCGTRLCILLNYVEQAEDKHRRDGTQLKYMLWYPSGLLGKINIVLLVIWICLEVKPEAWHLDMNNCLYDFHYLSLT